MLGNISGQSGYAPKGMTFGKAIANTGATPVTLLNITGRGIISGIHFSSYYAGTIGTITIDGVTYINNSTLHYNRGGSEMGNFLPFESSVVISFYGNNGGNLVYGEVSYLLY